MQECTQKITLLYGPPGCGKTSIVDNISKDMDIEYISVGAVTRREIASKTPVGKELQHCLDSITEYPTQLISSLMMKEVGQKKNTHIVLDGYPKYPNEAEQFVVDVKNALDNISIHKIIVVNLALEEALQRISSRRMCPTCLSQTNISIANGKNCLKCKSELIIRPDDETEAFKRRYRDYSISISDTLKILNTLKSEVVHVSGLLNPTQLAYAVRECLNKPG